MAKKSKHDSDRSTITINLGKDRKDRIRRFCAQVELDTKSRPTIEEAVNRLVDQALAPVENAVGLGLAG